ncbi:transcription initiation factor TFIID 23-30kDa subunit-domain-containing protein [Kockovaella imperatae]|uniref:Transcription initiation factor TFIID subunit 10 n=1 Tax=Kockovaella imperatae TaxID=4999 RepID=A0A1Y1UML4_9TREE|nr:transcription initiation factor TFIID 23-30kDa subunit-domain-containing protein [Kockovaella imperatae]ORX39303.1 transcription initiation factor TFIID 23-30kDa subunit-domain-containing protein [Kockovaella imperatae]
MSGPAIGSSQVPSGTSHTEPSTPVNKPAGDGDVQMNGTANGTAPPVNGTAEGGEGSGPAEGQVDNAQLFAERRAEELARRDRSLAEFLVMLDGYKPLIPEEVTEYYLQRAGFDCSDPRLKRLLSLSAQKFISDLSRDAFHFAKLRVNGTAAGRGRPAAGQDRNRVVLTMDDLSLALAEHGVNAKKPDYYL